MRFGNGVVVDAFSADLADNGLTIKMPFLQGNGWKPFAHQEKADEGF
jgi:hypothetical protein